MKNKKISFIKIFALIFIIAAFVMTAFGCNKADTTAYEKDKAPQAEFSTDAKPTQENDDLEILPNEDDSENDSENDSDSSDIGNVNPDEPVQSPDQSVDSDEDNNASTEPGNDLPDNLGGNGEIELPFVPAQ